MNSNNYFNQNNQSNFPAFYNNRSIQNSQMPGNYSHNPGPFNWDYYYAQQQHQHQQFLLNSAALMFYGQQWNRHHQQQFSQNANDVQSTSHHQPAPRVTSCIAPTDCTNQLDVEYTQTNVTAQNQQSPLVDVTGSVASCGANSPYPDSLEPTGSGANCHVADSPAPQSACMYTHSQPHPVTSRALGHTADSATVSSSFTSATGRFMKASFNFRFMF